MKMDIAREIRLVGWFNISLFIPAPDVEYLAFNHQVPSTTGGPRSNDVKADENDKVGIRDVKRKYRYNGWLVEG